MCMSVGKVFNIYIIMCIVCCLAVYIIDTYTCLYIYITRKYHCISAYICMNTIDLLYYALLPLHRYLYVVNERCINIT